MESQIAKAGWIHRGGKGCHRNWVHPLTGAVLTVSGKSGSDCPRYLERQIKKALEENP